MNINHIYEDSTIADKFYYDSSTETYSLHNEEWEEPMEFTEDELISEGIIEAEIKAMRKSYSP